MFQLYAAIWRVSSGRQIVLILLSLAIAFLAAVPLEFQKDIVNLLTENEINEEDLFWYCLFMMLAILLMNAFAPTIDHFVVQANVRRRKVRLG